MRWMSYLLALWVFTASVLPCDCDDHDTAMRFVSTVLSEPIANDCRDSRSGQIPCSPFCQTCHHAVDMPLVIQMGSPETEEWQDGNAFPALCFRICSRAIAIWQPPKVQLG